MERIERETPDQPASLEERQDGQGEPAKRHGDALLDGTGTRHGVDAPRERPIDDRSDASEIEASETEERP